MTEQYGADDGRDIMGPLLPMVSLETNKENHRPSDSLPEILFVSSYPPRECGIATYSQDLLRALQNKFSDSFSLQVCALEFGITNYVYPEEVKYVLDTTVGHQYVELAQTINASNRIHLVLVQHEFGLFQQAGEEAILQFLYTIAKPVIIVFHTVLPQPNESFKANVRHLANASDAVVVMTQSAAQVLRSDYGLPHQKIFVIAHGTHLVQHLSKTLLKDKYGLTGKKILSTFGLLNSGKGIETTLGALPEIIKKNPDVVFLVIGKTHPGVVKSEGEVYRNLLEEEVAALHLENHVIFINKYLPLQELLEYLQLTDIYLCTSKDPAQAVSGTFSYAMSCGCPIISTPIPHAREMLQNDAGILIDFQNARQLANGVNRLMSDEHLREAFSERTLQRVVPTAWENSAIAHIIVLQKITSNMKGIDVLTEKRGSTFRWNDKLSVQYRLPEINLAHVKKMTTDFGMIQFSKINQPDLESGYTLDDNARALIVMCMHYELTADKADLPYLRIYLDFIKHCLNPQGYFLNYVNSERQFTEQNYNTNLADANGRAVWALGHMVSKRAILPSDFADEASVLLQQILPRLELMHSPRAMAFAIKGLYCGNLVKKSPQFSYIIKTLARRLVQIYKHEAEQEWQWFESYMTYANSILPEAMLCAWLDTGELVFKETAKKTFDFLLTNTFNGNVIKVISNRSWLRKGREAAAHGEQPIDVAYTILALNKFYKVFEDPAYATKIKIAFNWFLGNNHLHQIVYNPCTGGCYDGLEDTHVNLNQGAESTLSYLLARLTIEKQSAQVN